MIKLMKKKVLSINESGFQDVIFFIGIFVITSILVIGLFPDETAGSFISGNYFVYAVMTVPIIAAIYFIIVSFRRNLYEDSAEIGSSIRKKLLIALIFVAILPAMPIVLSSNHILNQTLSGLVVHDTKRALKEAVSMSHEAKTSVAAVIRDELDTVDYLADRGKLVLARKTDRDVVRACCARSGMSVQFLRQVNRADRKSLVPIEAGTDGHAGALAEFYRISDFRDRIRLDRISLSGTDYLTGAVSRDGVVLVMYRAVPRIIEARENLFTGALGNYNKLERMRDYLMSGIGVYHVLFSLFMIIISLFVSLYLSKSITRPVLELSAAAQDLASGNFEVNLEREANDELGILFQSFNQMVKELDRNRKVMYQKQRLEAWRDMATTLVHEIKNPLTPIRLSAERMKKRFLEGHSDIEKIIISGTDTIIEEVGILMEILGEFTKFARLPEMNPQKGSVNELLENSIDVFAGHEDITFSRELDSGIPDFYFDRMLMKQAVTNLIQNAVEAIEGAGRISLSSRFERGDPGRTVRIEIADNGSGIREHDLEHIFEPGYSTKSTGTGLGLAIVEKIVLEHGGKISCETEPGTGSRFIITLPVLTKGELEYGEDTGS